MMNPLIIHFKEIDLVLVQLMVTKYMLKICPVHSHIHSTYQSQTFFLWWLSFKTETEFNSKQDLFSSLLFEAYLTFVSWIRCSNILEYILCGIINNSMIYY